MATIADSVSLDPLTVAADRYTTPRKFAPAQREHDAFLRRKVEVARASMQDGLGQLNEEVEAAFAARRAAHS